MTTELKNVSFNLSQNPSDKNTLTPFLIGTNIDNINYYISVYKNTLSLVENSGSATQFNVSYYKSLSELRKEKTFKYQNYIGASTIFYTFKNDRQEDFILAPKKVSDTSDEYTLQCLEDNDFHREIYSTYSYLNIDLSGLLNLTVNTNDIGSDKKIFSYQNSSFFNVNINDYYTYSVDNLVISDVRKILSLDDFDYVTHGSYGDKKLLYYIAKEEAHLYDVMDLEKLHAPYVTHLFGSLDNLQYKLTKSVNIGPEGQKIIASQQARAIMTQYNDETKDYFHNVRYAYRAYGYFVDEQQTIKTNIRDNNNGIKKAFVEYIESKNTGQLNFVRGSNDFIAKWAIVIEVSNDSVLPISSKFGSKNEVSDLSENRDETIIIETGARGRSSVILSNIASSSSNWRFNKKTGRLVFM